MLLLFGMSEAANAELIKIGTARYLLNNYNLIYEDDSIDGGLVWLDYTSAQTLDWGTWTHQVNWASDLGSNLTVNLYAGYVTNIDWSTGWRLPLTQDDTWDYNVNGSEMGHLYYDSLGKPAGGPLGDHSPFDNLQTPYFYWSGTETTPSSPDAWYFAFDDGIQRGTGKGGYHCALAVRPGTVSAAPVPEPATMLLLGTGLVGLAGLGRKKFFKK